MDSVEVPSAQGWGCLVLLLLLLFVLLLLLLLLSFFFVDSRRLYFRHVLKGAERVRISSMYSRTSSVAPPTRSVDSFVNASILVGSLTAPFA